MKFGYLGVSENIVESELITRFRIQDLRKPIVGYYANSNLPMIGILEEGSGSRMRVRIPCGTHYDIKAYRILSDSFYNIVEGDLIETR